jgi:hypothetical protein
METQNDCGKPWMTLDQAEEMVMASELGMFHGNDSELAHAILLIKSYEERSNQKG